MVFLLQLDKRTHWENLGKRCLNEAERQRQKKKAEVLSVPELEEVCEMGLERVACIFKKWGALLWRSSGPEPAVHAGGQVSVPVWDDPVWRGNPKPERHHRWRPRTLEPVLSNKRGCTQQRRTSAAKMDKILKNEWGLMRTRDVSFRPYFHSGGSEIDFCFCSYQQLALATGHCQA